MSDKVVHSFGGIGFSGMLTIVFITLKLIGVINWSWIWVLAPMWIPFIFIAICLVVILVIWLLANSGPRF